MQNKIKWVAVVVDRSGVAGALARGVELARQGVLQVVFLTGQEEQAKAWEQEGGNLAGLELLQQQPHPGVQVGLRSA